MLASLKASDATTTTTAVTTITTYYYLLVVLTTTNTTTTAATNITTTATVWLPDCMIYFPVKGSHESMIHIIAYLRRHA